MSSRQRTPQLIGREAPISELLDALAETADGSGALVLVSGEAGIGKTRLLEEFATRAEARVARGGCVEGVTYAPWTEALWWLLDSLGPEAADDLPEGVRAQLARLIPSLGGATPAAGDDGQHVLFEAVVQLVAYVAARGRLVVVIDDVHWIDPASRELLRHVASNLRRIPMVLVAAYRPEDSASERDLLAQLGRLAERRIVLDRLDVERTAEIAAILLGTDTASADVERVAHDAEGNPLFVEELVAAIGMTGVPPTVRDLMLSRFRSLDEDARQLVRIAALIGARAPRAWLVQSSGLNAARARAATRASVDSGVLVADEGGYEFRHALLRQAVLDELLPDEQIALHRDIAQALTDHVEMAVGVDRVAELARHWDAAEDPTPALRWLVAAAHQAESNYAFEAAFRAYERALRWWPAVSAPDDVAGIDHAELLLEAADAAGSAGHVGQAADLARAGLDESFALAPERGVDAAGRVYPQLWIADRAPELFEFASANLVPVLDRVDPAARARFLLSRVEHLATNATVDEIRPLASEMMDSVQGIDDPELQARAHMVNAWCDEAFGEWTQTEIDYERAAAIAQDAGSPDLLALIQLNHASFKLCIPEIEASLTLLNRVDEVVERFGLRRFFVSARRTRAIASCLGGDLMGARHALAEIDGLYAEGFDAWGRAITRAMVNMFAGDHEAVLSDLEPAAVGAAEPQDADHEIELAMLRAEALTWLGLTEAARRTVDEGEAVVENHHETYWHGRLAMAAVRVEADAATTASAERSIEAIELCEARAHSVESRWAASVGRLDEPTPLIDACNLGIAAEIARLRAEEVPQHMERGADAFEAIGVPYYAAYFRWREAAARLDRGERPTATDILKRARSSARSHGFWGLDAAIAALARAHQLRLGPGNTTIDGDEPLSVRELEVLRLVVDGRSNPEIAELLYISRRTAAAHVSNILRKFDASSRVEAVSEAHRRGYV